MNSPQEIVLALLDLKWSEAQIARKVGTNQSTINRIKKGTIKKPAYSTGDALRVLWAAVSDFKD